MKIAILPVLLLTSFPAFAQDKLCIDASSREQYNARPITLHDVLARNAFGADRRAARIATTCIHIYRDSNVALRSLTRCIALGDEAQAKLFGFDQEGWRAEFASIGEYLEEYGPRMPQALKDEQEAIKRLKLAATEKEKTIRQKGELIARYEAQMNTVSTKREMDALRLEIAHNQGACSQLEEEVLAAILEGEERTAKLPEAERLLAQVREDVAKFEADATRREADRRVEEAGVAVRAAHDLHARKLKKRAKVEAKVLQLEARVEELRTQLAEAEEKAEAAVEKLSDADAAVEEAQVELDDAQAEVEEAVARRRDLD